MDVKKSVPSANDSNSTLAVADEERVLFALSHAILSLRNARLLSEISTLCLRLNSSMKYFIRILSKSSPPR